MRLNYVWNLHVTTELPQKILRINYYYYYCIIVIIMMMMMMMMIIIVNCLLLHAMMSHNNRAREHEVREHISVPFDNLFQSILRTVPSKYKCFCARLGPRGKSRSLQGLLESTKKNRGIHAFFRDN